MSKSQAEFYQTLFGLKPDPAFILIWNLPDKKSAWFQNLEKAYNYVLKIGTKKKDIYYGLGLSPKDFGEKKRCSADEIIAIPGVWLDVDYQEKVHKKNNLPPNKEEASFLIHSLPINPTIIIHSGHGLQALWLFNEWFEISDQNSRLEAKKLVTGWNKLAQIQASRKNWTIDSTHDLSRLFRAPGSVNYKAEPIPVEVLHLDKNKRCEPSDILSYIGDIDVESVERTVVGGKGYNLVLSPSASPKFDKFQALYMNEDKFAKSWNHERKDLEDQSPSGYDQSLANFTAMVGWKPQEICDLLIAHRRKHGENLKLDRPDYYKRTIGKATDAAESQSAANQISQIDTTDEEIVRQLVSKILGVKLKKIIKMGNRGNYVYYFIIEHEDEEMQIHIGGETALLSSHSVRKILYAETGWCMQPVKQKKWYDIATAMSTITIYVEIKDARKDIELTNWIFEYIESTPWKAESKDERDEWQPAIPSNKPFIILNTGQVGIKVDAFRSWLLTAKNVKVSLKEIQDVLTSMGFIGERTMGRRRKGEKQVCRYYYWSNEGFWREDAE